MTAELLVAWMAHEAATYAFPTEPGVAGTAVSVALRCFEGGASLSEVCREARTFLQCRARHPSCAHRPVLGEVVS